MINRLENEQNRAIEGQPLEISGKSARRRFIERATIMGLGISVLFHLVLLLIASLVTVNFGFADVGGGEGEEVDFAILTQADLADLLSPEIEYEQFEVAVTRNEQAIETDLLSDISNDQSVSDLAESIAPSLESGGGSLKSIDATTGSAGAGTGEGASFFGLEAQGRRFAYIVDVSGSMNALTGDGEATRWELTRSEIIRSIQGFDQNAEFFIVLYSTNSISLFGNDQWVNAKKKNIRLAANGLFGFSPAGGTDPLPAFDMVFALDPKPDAIYFMTDGLLAIEVPAQIRQKNKRADIPIHSILFGVLGNERDARAAKNMMDSIAKYSGGKSTHIREGTP